MNSKTDSMVAAGRDGTAEHFLRTIWRAAGGDEALLSRVSFTGDGDLPSVFAVSDLAVASLGAAALAIAELIGSNGARAPAVRADRRIASYWYGRSLDPQGWSAPPLWDDLAGDYRTADGWIKLHTNAPHHRSAAVAALGGAKTKDAVRAAVARRRGDELEAAVLAHGGAAAAMRSQQAWAGHAQGKAVTAEPLIWSETTDAARHEHRSFDPQRPLAGVRVLDLTRIIAGPVATRFLAGFGADVLRIDPPDWEEPNLAPEVTLGKRCARLDLRDPAGRERFLALLADADMMVHGLRPGALDGLGLGADVRRRTRPGLVDVCLDAYGWTGPWAGRRGYDSLVQMSSGIADTGMTLLNKDVPTPLPVQALDHTTGYIVATAAIRGLTAHLAGGAGSRRRASLARTAALLTGAARPAETRPLAKPAGGDYDPRIESTPWGPARRLRPAVVVDGAPMHWERPSAALGSAAPHW